MKVPGHSQTIKFQEDATFNELVTLGYFCAYAMGVLVSAWRENIFFLTISGGRAEAVFASSSLNICMNVILDWIIDRSLSAKKYSLPTFLLRQHINICVVSGESVDSPRGGRASSLGWRQGSRLRGGSSNNSAAFMTESWAFRSWKSYTLMSYYIKETLDKEEFDGVIYYIILRYFWQLCLRNINLNCEGSQTGNQRGYIKNMEKAGGQ